MNKKIFFLKKIKNNLVFWNLLKNRKFDLLIYKLIRKINYFRNILPPLPNWIIIEPINICNLKCTLCPLGQNKIQRKPRAMTIAEYKSVINQVKFYVEKIVLFNYGEPFLHNDLPEMIRYATLNGISNIKVSTNGQVKRSVKYFEDLVGSGLKYLIVDIDGADDETLNKYRVGAKLVNIISTIENVNEARKKLKNKDLKLIAQFLVMKHNEDQISIVKKMAIEAGCDVFSKKSIFLFGDGCIQERAEKFLPNDNDFNRYKKSDGEYGEKGVIPNSCSVINNSLVICSNGDVLPCCFDSYSEYVMGNVFEEKIKRIWNGSRYRNFRKRIYEDRKSIKMCSSCSVDRMDAFNKQYQLK